MGKPVVVGFDDSEHHARTIEYAVHEALARRAPLSLVHAYRRIPAPAAGGPQDGATPEGLRQSVSVMLEAAAQKIRDENPGLVVETAPMQGDPPRALTVAARGAALLVVGGRGSGGFTGLMLGSVTLRALGMADCPVMVVRGDSPSHTGRIMVGVDLFSRGESEGAVDFAFAEAALHKTGVYAINIWEDPSHMAGILGKHPDGLYAAFGDLQRELLATVLEPWKQKYPDVTVTQQAFPGTPSRVLVDSTRLVDALVIGGKVHGDGRDGMYIGALGHAVLHHAHCPVIVVPEP